MNSTFIAIEAKTFCFVIVAFLLIFKMKSTLNITKNTMATYVFSLLGISFSALNYFLTGIIFQVICSVCYAAAIFFLLLNKHRFVAALSGTAFGVLTFLLFPVLPNITTYLLTLSAIVLCVFEQFSLITTDNLTGLHNLYARKLEIEEQEKEYKRDHNDSFYVISCDLDKFKTINDTWGHQEGDRALSLVADALTKVTDKFDAKAFRVGGDEFQIIADTSSAAEAEKIEKALEDEFSNIKFRDDFDIKISVGKVLYTGTQTTEELLAVADERLYTAKKKRK